jgi:hypothetical protein
MKQQNKKTIEELKKQLENLYEAKRFLWNFVCPRFYDLWGIPSIEDRKAYQDISREIKEVQTQISLLSTNHEKQKDN